MRRRNRLFLEGGKVAVRPGLADTLIISAKEDDGIGFWLVPGAAENLDRRLYRIADGSVAAELVLRGVEVLPGARLAGGFEALGPVVATARAAAAAEMLGLMTLLFDATLAYVKTRHQFGQPIGNFQVIQHRLAESYVKLEQSPLAGAARRAGRPVHASRPPPPAPLPMSPKPPSPWAIPRCSCTAAWASPMNSTSAMP